MVLTVKEKKLLLKLLKKERRKRLITKNSRRDIDNLIDNFEQNIRNEKINETKPSKL